MDRGQHAHLQQLCRIFGIPEAATSPNPDLALNVLLRMYLVPTIRAKSERNRALNDIRGNLAGQFDTYSPFVLRTAEIAAQMQELPAWWANLNLPTEELIRTYLSLDLTIKALKFAGISAGASAGGAGAAEAVKTGSVRQGLAKAGQRAIGLGGVLDETIKRIGRVGAAGSKVLRGAPAVATIAATALYASAVQQQEEIRAILIDRFQDGKMSDADFRRVFGSQIDPSQLKRYWE